MKRPFNKGIIIFLAFVFAPIILPAATLNGPVKSPPSAMLIIDVSTLAQDNQAVKLTFDPFAVQYIGPVSPSMEIQTSADGVVEINKTASESKVFSLKFIDLGKASDTVFKLTTGNKSEARKVEFVVEETQKSYHLHILLAAVVLLILGLSLRKVQKKAPSLMSTRSLFMNFEELQKVKDQYDLPVTPTVDEPPHTTIITAEPSPGKPSIESPESVKPPELAKANRKPVIKLETAEPEVSTQPMASAVSVLDSLQDRNVKTAQSIPAVTPDNPPARTSGPSSGGGIQKTKQSPSFKGDAIRPPPAENRDSAPKTRKTAPVAIQQVEKPAGEDSSEAKTMARPASKPQSTPSAQKIFIILMDPDGKNLEGTDKEIALGRRKENTIVFTNSEISRNHATIKRLGEGFTVSPLSANNLTEVNGKPVKGVAPIKEGDTLSLGGTPYRVTKLEVR